MGKYNREKKRINLDSNTTAEHNIISEMGGFSINPIASIVMLLPFKTILTTAFGVLSVATCHLYTDSTWLEVICSIS